MSSSWASQSNERVPQQVVGWTGPSSGCFGWLRARIERQYQVIPVQEGNWESYALDRWIYASPDRLSLPSAELQAQNIPLAIATSDWWEGAGRTGLRELQLPAIPWYRWWDGWHDWLEGTSSALFTPFPPRLAHALSPPMPATQFKAGSGWIIANCLQSADAWTLAANEVGHVVTWYTLDQFRATIAAPHFTEHPDWLLWDDTSLDTWNAKPDFASVSELLRTLHARYPEMRRLIALTLPRWDQWRELHGAGAQELIAKPTTAGVLYRSLSYLAGSQPAC